MIYETFDSLRETILPGFRAKLQQPLPEKVSGLCGFDGFIDTFIQMQNPASMEEFGPKVGAAAGIAASYPVRHLGDKFGGNGPLYAAALNDLSGGHFGVTYIGAMGRSEVLPIYREALASKTRRLYTLAEPAHSECLEFSDGKIMLGDLSPCAEITLERLLEVVGEGALDEELKAASFVAMVNWGKLPHAGDIWSYLARRAGELGRPPKEIHCFMDLAEFESRAKEDVENLMERLPDITRQFSTMLSFNLKEAWQMGSFIGQDFHGKKDAASVAALGTALKEAIEVDRIIIHPNDGAVCASALVTTYVPGPFCRKPLISTGAGDNFGAGCLVAALLGMEDAETVLLGNLASGHYVRTGHSANFPTMLKILDTWSQGREF
jgi:hypothetical protein